MTKIVYTCPIHSNDIVYYNTVHQIYKVDVTVNGKYHSEAFLKIILPPFQNTIRVSKYGNYMYFS